MVGGLPSQLMGGFSVDQDNYMKTVISRHKNSTEIFKVSKEFYKYCIDNKIDYIEYEMIKKFEQYIMPS